MIYNKRMQSDQKAYGFLTADARRYVAEDS